MAGNLFETGRDGTVLTCLTGKKLKAGRDGKMMKIMVAWMERNGTVGVDFLDGTVRYNTMAFLFHDGTER